MRKVRTVFCPDFLAQYKSIPLWRSTVFGWTARMMRSSRSVLLSPPARWTTRRCWSGCGRTVSDPLLTQNGIGTGRSGRKQWKTRRANGGKKHKSEPKQLRFSLETTYGPEGRGFESLTAYHCTIFSDIVCCLLSNVCVVTSFYQSLQAMSSFMNFPICAT